MQGNFDAQKPPTRGGLFSREIQSMATADALSDGVAQQPPHRAPDQVNA